MNEVSLNSQGGIEVKETRKEHIREKAIEVMAKYGFHNATTDKIAEEAGIAVGTIYNYFKNKEDILEYIFLVELEKRAQFYNEVRAKHSSLVARIYELLVKHFNEIKMNPSVGQIMVREQQFPNRHELTAVTKFLDGIPSSIAVMLEEAIGKQEIHPCNTSIIAAALFGSVQAVVSSAVFAPNSKIGTQILEDAPDVLIDFFKNGLQFIQ